MNTIKIAIIDSGICPHIAIDDFKIMDKKCFLSGKINSYGDETGHGTHIAGIIHQYSPSSHLYIAKILNKKNIGNNFHLIQAIEWSINHHVDLINISLVNPNTPPNETYDIIKYALSKGIHIVASGGNNQNKVCYPAKYPEVIGVTSISDSNELSAFGFYGDGICIGTKGEIVKSTWLGNQYKTLSGTSQATAITTGLIANILREKNISDKKHLLEVLENKHPSLIKIMG